MPIALSSIADVAVRDWVTKETITPGKLMKDPRAIRDAVNLTIRFLREMEKHFASGEPIDKVNGFLWYDAATALLKFYRSGAWEQVMTEKTAGSASIKAGGGTATGNLELPINVDTADVVANGANPTPISSYTVPANTLSANGDFITAMAWLTDALTASTTPSLSFEYGGISLGDVSLSTVSTTPIIQSILVRTASGAQKSVTWIKHANDGNGAGMVNVATLTIDETANQTLELGAEGIITGGTITQHAKIFGYHA